MPHEIVFRRADGEAISASELRQRLAGKFGIKIQQHNDSDDGGFLLGDLGITVELAIGQDDEPIAAKVGIPTSGEAAHVVALFRVFESIGWKSSKTNRFPAHS